MRQDFRALKSRKFPTHLQKVSKKLDSKNFYRVFRKILRRMGNHVVQKNQKKLQRRRFWPRRFSSFFQKSARRSKFTRLVLFLDRKIFHWRTLHERSIWASALCAALLFCQTSASLPKGAAPPTPVFLRFYSGFLCRVPIFPRILAAHASFFSLQKERSGRRIRMAFPAFVILLFSHGFFLCGQSALLPVFLKNWMNRPSSRRTLLRKALSAS